jgi:hypothetical protein
MSDSFFRKLKYNINKDGKLLEVNPFYARFARWISIPDSVTSIHADAFRNCSFLKSVTIPSRVGSHKFHVQSHAFHKCPTLQSVSFAVDVSDIGNSAFSGCSALESVTFAGKVGSITSDAFGGCSALKSMEFTAKSAILQCLHLQDSVLYKA